MRRRPGIGVLVLVLALPSALAGPPRDVIVWEAVPAKAGVTRQGETWTARSDAYAATLERLDDAARWEFLRAKAGAAADPFAASGGPGFLTFLFTVESTAAGTLVFDASACRLVTQDKTTRYALDLPSIESAYGLLEKEMPPAYRTARAALFDGTVFLEQGQRADGLLVFQAVPERTRSFELEVPLTTADGKRGGLTAAYRRARPARR